MSVKLSVKSARELVGLVPAASTLPAAILHVHTQQEHEPPMQLAANRFRIKPSAVLHMTADLCGPQNVYLVTGARLSKPSGLSMP